MLAACVLLFLPLCTMGSVIVSDDSSLMADRPQSRAIASPLVSQELPVLTTLFLALGFLAFLFPFRLFRLTPAQNQAGTRSGISSNQEPTLRPMEEVATLARKIITALEEEENADCHNYTACSYANEINKLGSKKEITLSILEKLTPSPLKQSLEPLRQALASPDPDNFCEQFSCRTNGDTEAPQIEEVITEDNPPSENAIESHV